MRVMVERCCGLELDVAEWYDQPIVELQHREAIRDQGLGIAYRANDIEVPARCAGAPGSQVGTDAGC